jgi:hypothetical protein
MNAQTKTTTIRSICPRCRSAETGILSRSPDKDVWIVNGCKVCLYAWRNTEAIAAGSTVVRISLSATPAGAKFFSPEGVYRKGLLTSDKERGARLPPAHRNDARRARNADDDPRPVTRPLMRSSMT